MALTELYAYYGQHERRLANILRDAESIPALREVNQVVIDMGMRRMREVLTAAWNIDAARSSTLVAVVGHVLRFHTWRSLTRDEGPGDEAALGVAVRMVEYWATSD